MKSIELIELIKNPAKDSYKEKNKFILPSYIIAHAIYCLDNGITTEKAVLNNNSIFNSKKKYKSYKTCIDAFQNSIKKSAMTLKDFVLSIYPSSNDIDDKIIEYNNIYDLYNLSSIDSELTKSYDNEMDISISENTKESFIDVYVVRKTYNSLESQILKTSNKEEAIKKCKMNPGYSVYNSRGVEIYTKTMTPEKVKYSADVIVTGLQVKLCNTNLYKNVYDKSPSRCITGTYYIFSGAAKNGRYAIAKSLDLVKLKNPNYIIGFVSKDSIS